MEVLIRENGGEPKWIDISKVFKVSGTRKPYSPSPPLLKDTKGFGQWYALYDKKTTKKQAIDYWFKNITKDDIPKIMEHTKQYIKDRDKVYRKDPIRYLRDSIKPLSLQEICNKTGFAINAVSGRVNDLKKANQVVEAEKRKCSVTCKTITPVTALRF